MVITNGYVPLASDAGTVKLAWYKPTPPGVRPIYATVAAAVPTVMVALALTGDKPLGAAAPVVSLPAAFTGPPPVKYATTTLPAFAGASAAFTAPSALTTTARLFPYT